MEKVYNRIVEERIKRWELENPKRKVSTPEKKPYPVITISREFGAKGAALANYMGEKIGFKIWDREILHAIADKLGSDHKFLDAIDETGREAIEDLIVGFTKNIYTNSRYIHTLHKVVKTIEELGNSVVVGRGSNFICENPKSLHVRIVSPFEKRVADYAEKENISVEEAKSEVEKTDSNRAEFIQHYFKKDVNDSSGYDLVLNLGTFDLHDMMMIILRAYERKTGFELEILN